MKYCISTTQGHPIAKAHPTSIEDFNNLLAKEGYTETTTLFNSQEIVLNLDTVEALIALNEGNRNRNSSMDITFGIADTNLANKMMVLVELRLNYTNPNNLKREKLEDKVAGSLLALTTVIPVYPDFIFVFQSDKTQEAKSRLFRMYPKIPNNYKAMDLEELKAAFF
jgi:hypothetical protein